MKYNFKYTFTLISILYYNCFLYGQDRTVDSLKLALKSAKHDTTRCNILTALSEIAPDGEWQKFNYILFKLSLKNSETTTNLNDFYLKNLAQAINNKAYDYFVHGKPKEALLFFNKSLEIQTKIDNKLGIATSLTNIGQIYKSQGNIEKAIETINQSLKLFDALGDRNGLATNIDRLAQIYVYQNDLEKGLDYSFKALKLRKEANSKIGISESLQNIGGIYKKKNKLDSALFYFEKSLDMLKTTNDTYRVAGLLNSIGNIYMMKGNLPLSQNYFEQSLTLRERINNQSGIANSLNSLGKISFDQKKYDQAAGYLLKSYQISKNLGYPENLADISRSLASIYKIKKDYKLALTYYEIHIKMRDSINNAETRKATIKSQLKYEYEKKAAADSVKVAEEKKVVAVQFKHEKTQRYALFGGLGLVGLFALFMVNRFRVTNKQKKLIEAQKQIVEEQKQLVDEKQKEILDSIHYAKRIQISLLPNEKYLTKHIPIT